MYGRTSAADPIPLSLFRGGQRSARVAHSVTWGSILEPLASALLEWSERLPPRTAPAPYATEICSPNTKVLYPCARQLTNVAADKRSLDCARLRRALLLTRLLLNFGVRQHPTFVVLNDGSSVPPFHRRIT